MSTLVRHPIYYFSNGTHTFRVENALYKLHDDILMRHSTFFKDMLTMGCAAPPYPPLQGKSDEDPILLEGECQDIFDLFLNHIDGRTRSVGSDATYSHEQIWDLLLFVEKYGCTMTRFFAINHLWETKDTYQWHPAELVRFGRRFNIPKLLKYGFKSLLDIPFKHITKEGRQQMGDEVFIALAYTKFALDQHTRIVACEEPEIPVHADDCQDPVGCREDWHAVWWNGMGRLLLDGKNPVIH